MARLRRLGVVKGTRYLRPADSSRQRAEPLFDSNYVDRAPVSLEVLFPGGYVAESDFGGCFILDHVYPLHYRHGSDVLAELLALDPSLAVSYTRETRLAGLDFRDFVFLDTETTGLAGAGTMAFMVGVAFFEKGPSTAIASSRPEDVLIVRQYFLRDPGDEPAMLAQLEELLACKKGLITFNGRAFDLPLLDNRYLMNRLSTRLWDLPHIDLLLASRRIWRARLGSCALGALEQNLLGLQRTQDDVPGWLIPSLYATYLRSGDAQELARVFYHNRMDMLSMITLAARIFQHLSRPAEGEGLDLLSLGRWQADLGLHDEAEMTIRQALDRDLPIDAYHQALLRLSTIYKQGGRRQEAVVVWQQIAFTSTDDISAYVELAKHFEWQEGDPAAALDWTQQALNLAERWPPSVRRQYTLGELQHRRERLLKKLP